MSPEFLLTSLIVVVTPGTGVLFTMSAGLSRGVRASVVAALGCTLGIVPHLAAAITGLAALLYASSVAFSTIKYLGVAYLLFMAWRTLQEHGALTVDADREPRSSRQVVTTGVLVNILNPKLSLFFFAFLPQFVDTRASGAIPEMLDLSAVFMALTFVVFVAYGVFAAAIRTHVVTRPRIMTWLRRVFAGAFVALGARLALADR